MKSDQQWIPVEERLPDRPGTYLVFSESADPERPFCATAYWLGPEQGWSLVKVWAEAVSHWMPLPDPPRMKRTDPFPSRN